MRRHRRPAHAPALALALALAAGCRSAPTAPPSGTLLLTVSPPATTVLVDERPLLSLAGAAPLRVSLRAGPHRLELRAPGFFTAYRDVAITPAAEQRLAVALRPDPDAPPPAATPARPLGELPLTPPDPP